MRKILLFIITICLISGAYSQKRVPASNSAKNYKVKAEVNQAFDGSEQLNGSINPYKEVSLLSEEIIGESFFDQQSNSGIANRIFLYDDGTIGATWTYGMNVSAFDDRGAGYNYFDGTEWGDWPTERIESLKCGWPTYSDLGENGEIVISHNASAPYGFHINRRSTKGEGDWTETIILGPAGFEKVTWPRVITTGENNEIIHLLGEIRNGYNGQDNALAYYRSMDGGETWDISNEVLEDVGPDYYSEIGADTYTWAEPKNGIIAFASVGMWHDIFIMKSDDDGESWDKTVVWEHPYPFYGDETVFTDTLWGPDHSGNIALDNDGKAHIVFGLSYYIKSEVGTTFTFWPTLSNGIAYWNEDMDPFEAENQHDALDPEESLIEDYNLIGWMQDDNGNGELDFVDNQNVMSYSQRGLVCMPNIMLDEYNNIYVTFAGTSETYVNDEYNFKHIYFRASNNNGESWTEHLDLTSDITHSFDECVWPQITKTTDDASNVYIMYNVDYSPGIAVGTEPDHDYEQNRMFFNTVETGLIWEDVNENNAFNGGNVSQSFPNPASDMATINVNLNNSELVHLEITNLVGQVVYTMPVQKLNKGIHKLTIDVSDLETGIYIYTVYAGYKKVNKKLIVE